MKVCVAGLGAVGGLVAARLALAGHEVSALARGATLTAVRERGLVLVSHQGERRVAHIEVAATAADLTRPDLLIVTFKGPALAADASQLSPLIDAHTVVLPMMNGVPWWFLQPGDAEPLASVDPHGHIAATLPLAQTLGAVVHLTCVGTAPGEVRHGFGERLIVGEPGGGAGERVERVAALLHGAGFAAERSSDIRRDIWFKLWGNMTTNPVSALTGAACDAILDDELVSAFMARGMAEAAAIGARIGCPIEQTPEARMAVTRQLGAFKTSMLVDAETGRALELDALVGAVREIGARVGVATPNIDALHGLARLMDRTRRGEGSRH
ncbi:2-dehydropantoate 2-reductase [uncultured Methylibium sp.]|uniref:2-dehydropantoate 2-reductase n=1 Tax=uncultured Methylibium sp. TaxID=381093 RepID=UPI0025ED16DE|nr:2-dehydropantoate 2-reductase [uncultured Methylibium sp.]